jgi:hypothetical protein
MLFVVVDATDVVVVAAAATDAAASVAVSVSVVGADVCYFLSLVCHHQLIALFHFISHCPQNDFRTRIM